MYIRLVERLVVLFKQYVHMTATLQIQTAITAHLKRKQLLLFR